MPFIVPQTWCKTSSISRAEWKQYITHTCVESGISMDTRVTEQTSVCRVYAFPAQASWRDSSSTAAGYKRRLPLFLLKRRKFTPKSASQTLEALEKILGTKYIHSVEGQEATGGPLEMLPFTRDKPAGLCRCI